MVYTLRFFLQNAVCFIILTYLVIVLIYILYTGCAKIKKIIPTPNGYYHYPKYVYTLFPLQFSTQNASHHTPFVYASIFSPFPAAVPRFCHKTRTLLYRFVHRGSQSHCAAQKQWRCTVLTVWKSHTQNAVDGCMTPVTQSQHLQSPYYHPAEPYIHPLTLTHTNPTTES